MQYVPSVEREYAGLQRYLKLPTCAVCAISGEREREYPGLQRYLKLPTCVVCAISGERERVSRVTEILEAAYLCSMCHQWRESMQGYRDT